ncbi:MAG TPA: hypothetical protein VJC37_04740 [Planctomycetota bacterium]|nr:hypothetical protein [Planctomycetota bacterium]
MKKIMMISAVLFAGILIAGCAMPAGGMKTRQLLFSNPTQKHVVYSNEVSQEFINGVEDMALGLLTCDAVTKASKPPLIVIRALETEGDVSFDTKKYMESERSILMGKAGDKVRFIDKETTEEANYYLYGIISAASTPPSNNPGRRRSFIYPAHKFIGVGVYSTANSLAQMAEVKQGSGGNNSYRFTMSLVDPRSNATIWKDECGFTLEEITQHNHYK